ncbi:MAG: YihY/virulence factor BrkB family protein, partial [Asticcacaulis sp.]|nr:YihY/virulence factor BrkB family protein [Asticcacaulis sp.]
MTPGNGARPHLTLNTLLFILRETIREWNDDKVPRLGAALAFYSMLSIGPLLLIAIAIASAVFGHDANGYILAEIRRLIGYQGAQAVGAILADAHSKTTSTVVMAALVLSTALSVVATYFPGATPGLLFHLANLVVSFLVITVLFAMIFKILPDVHIKWRDVWVGAGLTALLFSVGKYLIGVYLARSAFSSAYGAAGSVIVVLAWIYYSAQIFFIGAEFTQVYTRFMGRQIVIKRGRPQPINVAKEDTAHKG